MKDLSREVAMLCPLCENDQFECLDEEFEDGVDTLDEVRFRCSDCGSVFTKEELIAEAVERVKEECTISKRSFLKNCKVKHDCKQERPDIIFD